MRQTVDEPTNRTKVHRWGLWGWGRRAVGIQLSFCGIMLATRSPERIKVIWGRDPIALA